MAIIKTGAIYKSLQFGGVDSRDYGIYITGAAVYNAPGRDVELVNVPGRNGALILDNGHWNNIEVTYPAGSFAPDQATFAANFASFRNAIVSQVGYQRLTDGYNTGEYRIAAYLSGLEVDPAGIGQAGQFEIRFNCKPQRFLTSGETLATVAASGDTVTNPTLYESSPLVVAEGYGKIGFNGYHMEIFNTPIGTVNVSGYASNSAEYLSDSAKSWEINYNPAFFASGDEITMSGFAVRLTFDTPEGCTNTRVFVNSGSGYSDVTYTTTSSGPTHGEATFTFPQITFTAGTDTNIAYAFRNSFNVQVGGVAYSISNDLNDPNYITIDHDAATGTIRIGLEMKISEADFLSNPGIQTSIFGTWSLASIIGVSSKPSASGDIYIDTEIGEAYTIQGGEPVSINSTVSIGSDLPVLAPGANAVTFDNTITALSIAGRWWQL